MSYDNLKENKELHNAIISKYISELIKQGVSKEDARAAVLNKDNAKKM